MRQAVSGYDGDSVVMHKCSSENKNVENLMTLKLKKTQTFYIRPIIQHKIPDKTS